MSATPGRARRGVSRASILAALPEFLLALWCGWTVLRLVNGADAASTMPALFLPSVEIVGLLLLRMLLIGSGGEPSRSTTGIVLRLFGAGIALWFYGGFGLLLVFVMFLVEPLTGLLLGFMLLRRIAFALANRPREAGDIERVRAYLGITWRASLASSVIALCVGLLAALALFGGDLRALPEDLSLIVAMIAMTAYFALLGVATLGEAPGTVLPDDDGVIRHPPVAGPRAVELFGAFVVSWPVLLPGVLLTWFTSSGIGGAIDDATRIVAVPVFTAMGAWLVFAAAAWARGQGCRKGLFATGFAGATAFLQSTLWVLFVSCVIWFFAIVGLVVGVGGYDVEAYEGRDLPFGIWALAVAGFAAPLPLWARSWPILVVPFMYDEEEDRHRRGRAVFSDAWGATEGTPALLGASVWVIGTFLLGIVLPLTVADALVVSDLWADAMGAAGLWVYLGGLPLLAVVTVDRAVALGLGRREG